MVQQSKKKWCNRRNPLEQKWPNTIHPRLRQGTQILKKQTAPLTGARLLAFYIEKSQRKYLAWCIFCHHFQNIARVWLQSQLLDHWIPFSVGRMLAAQLHTCHFALVGSKLNYALPNEKGFWPQWVGLDCSFKIFVPWLGAQAGER